MTSDLWPFAGKPVISKDSTFGGLVFDAKGIVEPTARWRDGKGFAITPFMQSRPSFGVLINNEQALCTAAASVGRIRTGKELLCGWVSTAGGSHYFISTAHNFDPTNLVGSVCFEETWEGETYIKNNPTFDVTYEAALQNAHIVVWKFNTGDVARLPAALHPGVAIKVNDPVVSVSYSEFPNESIVLEHYNKLPHAIRQTIPNPPTLQLALQVLHPNSKTAGPGHVTGVTHVVNGQPFAYAVSISLYHGTSGGPIFAIGASGDVGVSGQVIGALGTEDVNANTVLNLHHPDVAVFLNQYMS